MNFCLFLLTKNRHFTAQDIDGIRIRSNREINSIDIDANNNLFIGLDLFDLPMVKYKTHYSEGADAETRRELKSDAKQTVTALKSLKNYFDQQDKKRQRKKLKARPPNRRTS